jgi:hypothetical protein
MAKYTKSDIAQSWAFLTPFKGRQVKAEVQTVSRSGMSRRIRFYAAYIDGRTNEPGIADITWAIARIGDYGMNDSGLRVDGCGMDMCFLVISNFNYAAASHDLEARGLDISWNTPEGKAALGLDPDARIYDDYFFNANRL